MEIPINRLRRTSNDRFKREQGSYGARHLVHHLTTSEKGEHLRRLLFAERNGGNTWYYTRVISCSDLSGYLSDLDSAQEFFLRNPANELDRATKYSDALIFPLLISGVRESYQHLTGPLLGATLKHGIWSWGYIEKIINGIADEARRLELIAYSIPYLSGDEKISSLTLAKKVLGSRTCSHWLVNISLLIMPYLSNEEKNRFGRFLLRKIREAIRSRTSWDSVTYGLKRISVLLEGQSLASALLIIGQYEGEDQKIDILVSLFPKIERYHAILSAEWERRRPKGESDYAVDLAFRIWNPVLLAKSAHP